MGGRVIDARGIDGPANTGGGGIEGRGAATRGAWAMGGGTGGREEEAGKEEKVGRGGGGLHAVGGWMGPRSTGSMTHGCPRGSPGGGVRKMRVSVWA